MRTMKWPKELKVKNQPKVKTALAVGNNIYMSSSFIGTSAYVQLRYWKF